eukprot:jgi/Galph1/2702/GphlegSOOS_G1350.1
MTVAIYPGHLSGLVYPWGLVETTTFIGALTGALVVNWTRRVLLSRPFNKGLFVKRRPVNRRCPRCSGFGIYRCPLCRGGGVVDYEKKYLHNDPCPMCLCRRYVTCALCKGSGVRPKVSLQPEWFTHSWIPNVPLFIRTFKEWRRRHSGQLLPILNDLNKSGIVLNGKWTAFPLVLATVTLFWRWTRRLRRKTSFS